MDSFQWTQQPFPLNCGKDNSRICLKEKLTFSSFFSLRIAQYLIVIVIHQAFLVHGAIPCPHAGRDRMLLWFSWDSLPEKFAELFSAFCVTAAPHRPHQGEGKCRLCKVQSNDHESGKMRIFYWKQKLSVSFIVINEIVLPPWSTCGCSHQQDLCLTVQKAASKIIGTTTPHCCCCL